MVGRTVDVRRLIVDVGKLTVAVGKLTDKVWRLTFDEGDCLLM